VMQVGIVGINVMLNELDLLARADRVILNRKE
jgi:hypothetical protein